MLERKQSALLYLVLLVFPQVRSLIVHQAAGPSQDSTDVAAAVVAAAAIVAAPNPPLGIGKSSGRRVPFRSTPKGQSLHNQIEDCNFTSSTDINEILSKLTPILTRCGDESQNFRAALNQLKQIGVSDENLRTLRYRRQLDRRRHCRAGGGGGGVEKMEEGPIGKGKHRRLVPPRQRGFGITPKAKLRRDRMDEAREMEVEALRSRIAQEHLSFEVDPEEFVKSYDVLKGSLSQNLYGRLLNQLMAEMKVPDDWRKAYTRIHHQRTRSKESRQDDEILQREKETEAYQETQEMGASSSQPASLDTNTYSPTEGNLLPTIDSEFESRNINDWLTTYWAEDHQTLKRRPTIGDRRLRE